MDNKNQNQDYNNTQERPDSDFEHLFNETKPIRYAHDYDETEGDADQEQIEIMEQWQRNNNTNYGQTH